MSEGTVSRMLLEVGAVELNTEEGFVYASGKQGPVYCDNRVILSYPEKRTEIVEAFLTLIREKGLRFDIVAGVATGAIAWAALVAEKLGKPLVYVRASAKEHGRHNQIEGELEEGKTVVVIEDLVNSGGSSVAACEAVRGAGNTVVACLAIFSYGFDEAGKKFTRANIPLYSLGDFPGLVKCAMEINYLDEGQRKALLSWHRNPEGWKP